MGSSTSNFALYGASRLAKAQSVWRDAARLVSIRWEIFLQSEPDTRAFAFSAYVAALDAEEAAATDIARFLPGTAGHDVARMTYGLFA